MCVNALGGVRDPDSGELVAGPRGVDGAMLDAASLLTSPGWSAPQPPLASNTTIGVVATSAALTRAQANRLAGTSHDGIAMAVRPAHMMGDGDTLFALSTGTVEAPDAMDRICAAADPLRGEVGRSRRQAGPWSGRRPVYKRSGDERERLPWVRLAGSRRSGSSARGWSADRWRSRWQERAIRWWLVASRTRASAVGLAARIQECEVYALPQEVVDASDVVFVTTTDGAIAEVAAAQRWRPGQGVVHCAGAATLDVLEGAARDGALTLARCIRSRPSPRSRTGSRASRGRPSASRRSRR